MKRLQIFKAGRQTASSGETSDFTEDHLRQTVEAYDPQLHEAPIVVGHPKDNAPAYGWIKGLEFGEDGILHADADQVHAEFEEMVKSGAFKKRSASFYKPDSPSNPKPGVYYLRHVGFLGAQPPAVKGLADPEFQEGKVPDAVEFNDSADDVVEFSDTRTVATLFRRMREWILATAGQDAADNTLPAFLIEDLEDEARREMESTSDPAFSEGNDNPTGDNPMALTEQEIKDLQAKAAKADTLEQENADLKKQAANFNEREKKLARAEIERSVDALIDEGKVLPAERENEINYLESLDNENQEAVEFSEGEGDKAQKKKLSQRAAYLDRLAKRPPMVDFEERSRESGDDAGELDYAEVAEQARAYQDSERAKGRNITTTQAVKAVKAGKHKQ